MSSHDISQEAKGVDMMMDDSACVSAEVLSTAQDVVGMSTSLHGEDGEFMVESDMSDCASVGSIVQDEVVDTVVIPFDTEEVKKPVASIAAPKQKLTHQTATQQKGIETTKNSSLDYYETGNNMHALRQVKYTQESKRLDQCCMWFQVFLIGLVVGSIGIAMRLANTNQSKQKFNLYYDYIVDQKYYLGCVIYTAICLCYNICTAVVVLFFSPQSGSSGVPELKTYLNGSNIPDGFSFRTLCFKILSSLTSVLSAFPCGLQGPMLHIGAICGAWMSSTIKKTTKRVFCCARVDEEIRDDADILLYPAVIPSYIYNEEYASMVHAAMNGSKVINSRQEMHGNFVSNNQIIQEMNKQMVRDSSDNNDNNDDNDDNNVDNDPKTDALTFGTSPPSDNYSPNHDMMMMMNSHIDIPDDTVSNADAINNPDNNVQTPSNSFQAPTDTPIVPGLQASVNQQTFLHRAHSIGRTGSVTIDGDIVPVTSLGKSVLYTAGLTQNTSHINKQGPLATSRHEFRKTAQARKLKSHAMVKEQQHIEMDDFYNMGGNNINVENDTHPASTSPASSAMSSPIQSPVLSPAPSPIRLKRLASVPVDNFDVSIDTRKTKRLCPGWFRAWQLPNFNTDIARRDFLAMGCAAGMAASMGAPIGGVLLVLEELGSHWTNSLALKLLACAVFAGVMAAFFGTAAAAEDRQGEFLPEFYSTFFVGRRAATYRIEEIPFFLLCGFIVAIFTMLHVKLQFHVLQFKRRQFAGKKWLHLFATIVCACVWCAISQSIIFMFDCIEVSADYQTAQLLSNGGAKETFYGVQANCAKGYHNPMAALSISRYDLTVKRLLSRGLPDLFPAPVQLLWLFISITLFNFPAFVAMTPGVILPFMVMGSTTGRICGKILYDLFGSTQLNVGTVPSIFFDPGVYAAVGTSAVFASSTQSTLSMSIAVMEITADQNLLMPILLGSVVAHITSSPFMQPYYMALINFRGLPFLAAKPPRELNYMVAKDVMEGNPVILGSFEKVSHILEILETCEHNGFAVVLQPCSADHYVPTDKDDAREYTHSCGQKYHHGNEKTHKTYIGLMIRRILMVLLNRRIWRSNAKPFTPEDYDRVMSREPPLLAEQREKLSPEDLDAYIDLVPWVDSSAYTVQENMTATHAYTLFRTMQLRHLPVCDMKMNVIGMITRFELLAPIIQNRYHALLQKEQASLEAGGPSLVSDWCTRNTALEQMRRYQLIKKQE